MKEIKNRREIKKHEAQSLKVCKDQWNWQIPLQTDQENKSKDKNDWYQKLKIITIGSKNIKNKIVWKT